MIFKKRFALLASVLTLAPASAWAYYSVHDPITNANLSSILLQIGHAVNATGNKIASAIEASAKMDREYQAVHEQNRRLEDARRNHTVVAESICGESLPSGMSVANHQASVTKSMMRNGKGVQFQTPEIRKVIMAPKTNAFDDAALMQQAHALYCDESDYAAYGGSKACPKEASEMPGADKRVDTLLIGAGKDDKVPELTFSQKQMEVGMLYIKNVYNPTIAPKLTKEQANTEKGREYIGLMTAYEANLSVAMDPAMKLLAKSAPNPATKVAVDEARQSSSASVYFEKNASPEAKKNGYMSQREMENFDIYRRYGNPEYAADLQEMNGNNLLRENIRVQLQTNALLLKIQEELVLANMLTGQHLATAIRAEYAPMLQSRYEAVTQDSGKNK